MTTAVLTQPRRELTSLTAEPERRLLLFLAARVPAGIGPDHLTALGLVAMLAAGAAYALSSRWPLLLLAVNVALVANWLGDSLDGTLARYRQRTRPRYGFYVDHMVDAFGALLLLGLAASGWIAPGWPFRCCWPTCSSPSTSPWPPPAADRFLRSFGGTGLSSARSGQHRRVAWPQVALARRVVMLFVIMAGSPSAWWPLSCARRCRTRVRSMRWSGCEPAVRYNSRSLRAQVFCWNSCAPWRSPGKTSRPTRLGIRRWLRRSPSLTSASRTCSRPADPSPSASPVTASSRPRRS